MSQYKSRKKNEGAKVLVFMSFLTPESTWLSLGKELEKVKGFFVVKGFPENNYKELDSKIFKLKKKGVKVAIKIDPLCFTEYQIKQTPTFVVESMDYSYKICSDCTLLSALERIGNNGEQQLCNGLIEKLLSPEPEKPPKQRLTKKTSTL